MGYMRGKILLELQRKQNRWGVLHHFGLLGILWGDNWLCEGLKLPKLYPPQSADKVSAASEIGGYAVICPNLDTNRSLLYLVRSSLGRYIEQSIVKNLKNLAWHIYRYHSQSIDTSAIERVNSIYKFDKKLVIKPLFFFGRGLLA
jgi:predicted alpha/beta-fold hydrolase